MAGRRLLDVAKIINATRSVAKQHFALRSQQYEVFDKTSTLARAVKSQTDRVTLTAQAAIALARRLNETEDGRILVRPERPPSNEPPIPRPQGDHDPKNQSLKEREGIEQDHHYKPPESHSVQHPGGVQELDVKQEQPTERTLPDGTFVPDVADPNLHTDARQSLVQSGEDLLEPRQNAEEGSQSESSHSSSVTDPRPRHANSESTRRFQRDAEFQIPAVTTAGSADAAEKLDQDVYHQRPRDVNRDLSSLPRVEIPKNTQETQLSEKTHQTGINSDVYPTPNNGQRDSGTAEPDARYQQDVPHDVNVNVFRTPRVSKLLGVNPYKRDRTPANDTPRTERSEPLRSATVKSTAQDSFPTDSPNTNASAIADGESEKVMRDLGTELAKDAESPAEPQEVSHRHTKWATTNMLTSAWNSSNLTASVQKAPFQMRESRVPSSRFGRLWQYAGLGTSMALGAVSESFRRVAGSGSAGSIMLSPANLERLVAKLSRMRGAALKLGQMVSFQDLRLLPAPIHEVLQRVQDSADYMPASQRDKVLANNLGSDWRDMFESFGEVPVAAASIGQVHRAILKSTGQEVAVKVQYPGVAQSIDSDLNNLSVLLTASRLLPKGLYLEKTIANARVELAWECDYVREAQWAERFRTALADETETFTVPAVIPEASGKEVLTAEYMSGTAVTKHPQLSQAQRDWIGTQILRLCLREMVEFKFMQTDPNWTNFLYNSGSGKLELLDFGASRAYPDRFIEPYLGVLQAAARNGRGAVRDLSVQLGYLTGDESRAMRDAHIDSVLTLAEPFGSAAPALYDFRDQTITDRVRALIPLMVRERLAPPPEETYSLHRKLSGAFLLCARLGSRVPCRELFTNAMRKWEKAKKAADGAGTMPTSQGV